MVQLYIRKEGSGLYGADDHAERYIARLPDGAFEVNFTTKKPTRRSSMNSFAFWFYSEVSRIRGDVPIREVRAECKYECGRDILYADPHYGTRVMESYEFALSQMPTYEAKLLLMTEGSSYCTPEGKIERLPYLPITSLFDDAQMRRYLDDIARYYAENGIVVLTSKERQQLASWRHELEAD